MTQDEPTQNQTSQPQSSEQPSGGNAPPGPADISTPKIIYILHLLGLLTAGITSLIAVIMAYINKSDAPEWLQTHYRFQIRTFWMGLLYGFIAICTTMILIGFILLIVVTIWWIARNAYGLKFLSAQQAVANPKSWLLGRK